MYIYIGRCAKKSIRYYTPDGASTAPFLQTSGCWSVRSGAAKCIGFVYAVLFIAFVVFFRKAGAHTGSSIEACTISFHLIDHCLLLLF